MAIHARVHNGHFAERRRFTGAGMNKIRQRRLRGEDLETRLVLTGISFVQREVDDSLLEASSVKFADIDGDEIDDIVAIGEDSVVWYKGTGGENAGFSEPKTISTSIFDGRSIAVADLDGDEDLDVVSASYLDSKIAWYENADGQGNFNPQQLISTNAIGAAHVSTGDVDNDGDVDVISASAGDGSIHLYPNRGGFNSLPTTITRNAEVARSAFPVDIDGDEDLDVVVASYLSGVVSWFEFDEQTGRYGIEKRIDVVPGVSFAFPADLGGDDLPDIVVSSISGTSVRWSESDEQTQIIADENGDDIEIKTRVFDVAQPISDVTQGTQMVIAGDVDGDGDEDVISASFDDGIIAWYQQNGDADNGFNDEIQTITEEEEQLLGAVAIDAADIDDDGDLDIVAVSQSQNKVVWFESNRTFVVEQFAAEDDEYEFITSDAVTLVAPGVLSNDSPFAERVELRVPPQNGTVELSEDGGFEFTPNPGFSGEDTFTYEAFGALGQSDEAEVTLRIVEPLEAEGDEFEFPAGETTSVEAPGLLANDTSNAERIQLQTGPANGTVELAEDGGFEYTPNEGFAGEDEFTYQIFDSFNQVAAATVSLTVVAPELVVENDTFEIPGGETTTVEAPGVLANDPNGVRSVVKVAPENGTLELAEDGSFEFTPENGFVGADEFTYEVSDIYGQVAEATVSLTVVAPALELTDDTYELDAGDTLTVAAPGVLDNDSVDSGALTVKAQPENGSLELAEDGGFEYTPADGFSGVDQFTYELVDSFEQVAEATVSLTVVAPELELSDDAYQLDAGDTLSIAAPGVLSNDSVDAGNLTVKTPPANGSLELAEDGGFEYTPADGFSGVDQFTYELVDEFEQVAEATVRLTVVAPDATPDLPGDANRDNTVDVQDFLIVSRNFNTGSDKTWEDGDFDGDGSTDVRDFLILSRNFGNTVDPTDPPDPPTEPELPGDANGDNTVDVRDFLVLSRNFNGTDTTVEEGDLDGDGNTNVRDFLILSRNFGNTVDPTDPPTDPTDPPTDPTDPPTDPTNPPTEPELPGDANGDNTVNVSDFLVLSRNFNGTETTVEEGDFDGDGNTSVRDFLILSRNFGSTIEPNDPPTDPPDPPADLTLPGDANGDNTVNVSDFLVLSRNFNGAETTVEEGDFDGDGNTSVRDFLVLSRNFGMTIESAAAEAVFAQLGR